VTRVFPSGDRLPANCLKFYVHFSAPMREGREIFEQIQIVSEDGEVVPDPWRRVELWSTDAKRLTLWIHPGRIKRGVNLREEFGPVLRPNQKYRLVIPKRVLGANGMKLEAEFSKAFETTAEDHTRPLPKHWQIDAPSVGTREPLQIRFGKSLDRAQLLRMITVVASDGRTIRGSISIGSGESTWNFRPSENWMNNRHQLIVDGRLEDAAGNTPLRPFDNDLGSRTLVAPRLSITFTPSFKPKDWIEPGEKREREYSQATPLSLTQEGPSSDEIPMKPYTAEIEIELPRDRVIELFDNSDNVFKWQNGLQSFDHVEGEPGQPGAVSKLVYDDGKHRIELTETVTKRNLPDEFDGTYEWSSGMNTLNNRFIEIGPNRTKWESTCEYEFRGFMLKLMGIFAPGMFRKQNLKFMENFKRFAETGYDVRDEANQAD
jgi:hypothetical protein